MSSLKVVPLTAENINQYSTDFNYIKKDNNIIFYVQTDIGNFSIQKNGTNLSIKETVDFENGNNFYFKNKNELNQLKNINNWISYDNTFNKNNLQVSETRSHFNIKNNHLFTSPINSISASIPVNIMTLKNQLNQISPIPTQLQSRIRSQDITNAATAPSTSKPGPASEPTKPPACH